MKPPMCIHRCLPCAGSAGRHAVARSAAAAVLAAVLAAPALAQPLPADVQDRARAAATVAEARTILGQSAAPEPGRRVRLEVPDIVGLPPKGSAAMTVRVTSELPATEWIAVFVEPHTRAPLVALSLVASGAKPVLRADVTVSRTTTVRALVRAGGRFYEVTRQVKTATVGCRNE